MAEPEKKTFLLVNEKSQICRFFFSTEWFLILKSRKFCIKLKNGKSRNAILNKYKIS